VYWNASVSPFRGETSALIFNAILEHAPVAPVRLNPDLSLKAEEIIGVASRKWHCDEWICGLVALRQCNGAACTVATSVLTVALSGAKKLVRPIITVKRVCDDRVRRNANADDF
jgi:hypothetical protein